MKIRVLRALWRYQGRDFTVRELAKLVGLSHTGVKRALGELEEANVVAVRTIGRSYACRLNVNSYAASIVEKAFDLERGTLPELREMMGRRLESPMVVSAALFGSVVQGRETPRSDIDLFVVTEEREKVEEVVAELQRDVAERFGNSISAYCVGLEDLRKKRNAALVKQVLQNHLLICGRPLGESRVGES